MAPKPLDPRTTEYWLVLVTLIVLTVADGVLIAILMFRYTDTFSLYINQGTAFVYGVSSSLIVFCLARTRSEKGVGDAHALVQSSQDLPAAADAESAAASSGKGDTPWYILVAIGCMNGSGNCCLALGQPHVKGSLQALFGLSLIPTTMLCSLIFLKKRPSVTALFAATLIVAGIASSSAAAFNDSSGGVTTYWYSVAIFAFAFFIFSGEQVFEEFVFKRFLRQDVLVMFMWTVWTQFFLGWALYPLQAIPAFGGVQISDLPSVIFDGLRCTAGLTSQGADRPECSWVNPVLFFTYCAVDFACYAWGLYVIQRGGANLMALASAVATPLKTLVFALPINLAGFGETLHWTDAAALVMVVAGFGIYTLRAPESRQNKDDESPKVAQLDRCA